MAPEENNQRPDITPDHRKEAGMMTEILSKLDPRARWDMGDTEFELIAIMRGLDEQVKATDVSELLKNARRAIYRMCIDRNDRFSPMTLEQIHLVLTGVTETGTEER